MPEKPTQSHPRVRGRLRVRFGLGKPDRSAFTMNVSLTGAFIRTNQVFGPGQTMKVELELPDGPITLLARVVWAKRVPAQLAHVLPCGMGVRFVDPGPEWTAAFDRWQTGKSRRM
jgi:hypothetical protein